MKSNEKLIVLGIFVLFTGVIISITSGFAFSNTIDTDEKLLASTIGSNTIGVNLSGNNYKQIIIDLNGTYQLSNSSKIQMLNTQEVIVYSFPLTNLPTTIPINESGQYVIKVSDVALSNDCIIEIFVLSQTKELIFPFSTLNIIGAPIGIFGLILTVIGFLLFNQKKQDSLTNGGSTADEIKKYVSNNILLRISYSVIGGFFTLIACFTVLKFLYYLFSIPENLNATIVFTGVITGISVSYWLFFPTILKKLVDKMTFTDVFSIQKLSKKILYSLVLMGFSSVVIVLTLTVFSVNSEIIFNITNGTTYFIWGLYLLFIWFAPFIDLISVKGSIILSLKEFCNKSKKQIGNLDFSLLDNASQNLSEFMDSYNISIPRHKLAFALSCKYLKNGNKNTLIDLAKKIEDFPKNFSSILALIEDFLTYGKYSESRGISGKIPSAKMIQILKLGGAIVPSITAIIQAIQFVSNFISW